MSARHSPDKRLCEGLLYTMTIWETICDMEDGNYAVDLFDMMESISKYDFTIGYGEGDDRIFFFDFLKDLYIDKRWGSLLGDKTEMSRQDFIDHFTNRHKINRSRQYLSSIWSTLVDFECFVETERKGIYRANLPMIQEEIKKSNRA